MLFLYSSVICLFSLNIMFEEFVHVDPHGTFTQHVASHRLSQFTNPLPCWTFGLCPVFFFLLLLQAVKVFLPLPPGAHV